MPDRSRSAPAPEQRAEIVARMRRASGGVASAALARMEETLPWFRTMPAETRAWIGLVAQAGVATFIDWYSQPEASVDIRGGEVFAAAPRELARAVTLRQTVDMVRTTVEVMENAAGELGVADEHAQDLREAVLRYSREIAFAAAQVYAAAAEQRGAWDARLEALVVDALVQDEVDDAVRSRAAALGWATPQLVAVLAGNKPAAEPPGIASALHRAARSAGLDVLAGVQGQHLVVVVGGPARLDEAVGPIVAEFGAGPVVLGPAVPELLAAGRSARAALAGHRAVPAWPGAPRLVHADQLLPERALAGDVDARRYLVAELYRPLAAAGGSLLETAAQYLELGGSLEGAARLLYVHPNTVRYRLRRVTELTGYAPGDPRQAFALRVALVLGRLRPEELL